MYGQVRDISEESRRSKLLLGEQVSLNSPTSSICIGGGAAVTYGMMIPITQAKLYARVWCRRHSFGKMLSSGFSIAYDARSPVSSTAQPPNPGPDTLMIRLCRGQPVSEQH